MKICTLTLRLVSPVLTITRSFLFLSESVCPLAVAVDDCSYVLVGKFDEMAHSFLEYELGEAEMIGGMVVALAPMRRKAR